jgi:hypothetical protein
MGGRQRTNWIEFNKHVLDLPLHQISGHPANPYCGSTVRTGRSAHDWANHIVEYTWGIFHFSLFYKQCLPNVLELSGG